LDTDERWARKEEYIEEQLEDAKDEEERVEEPVIFKPPIKNRLQAKKKGTEK